MGVIEHQPQRASKTASHKEISPPTPIAPVIEGKIQTYEALIRRGGFRMKPTDGPTCFDHSTWTAKIGFSQLDALGIRGHHNQKIDYIVLHELAHFLQLMSDPVKYKEIINEGTRADGLGKVYFRLYNALLDVFVNLHSCHVAPIHRQSGECMLSKEAQSLYRDHLFSERDLRKAPLCVQFQDYLLLGGLGLLNPEVEKADPKGPYQFSPEVLEVCDNPIQGVGGIKYRNAAEAAKSIMWDGVFEYGTGQIQWPEMLSTQKYAIDAVLRPLFEQFLTLDQKNGTKIPDDIGGDLSNPTSLDNIDKIIEGVAERNKSPAERAQDQAREQIAEHTQNQAVADSFYQLLKEVAGTTEEFFNLWNRLREKKITMMKTSEPRKMQGALSIDDVIEGFGDVQSRPHEAQVFDLERVEPHVTYQPRVIQLYLVLDLSTSMDTHLNQIKRMFTAIGASCARFNNECIVSHTPQEMELVIMGYSDDHIPIADCGALAHIGKLVAPFAKIATVSGTSSHFTLRKLADLLKQEQHTADTLRMVIELTDGDTSKPDESKEAIDDMRLAGARVCGVKINGAVVADAPPHAMWRNRDDESKQPPPRPQNAFQEQWGADGIEIPSVKACPGALLRKLGDIIDREE